jgi:hypothetical protein
VVIRDRPREVRCEVGSGGMMVAQWKEDSQTAKRTLA